MLVTSYFQVLLSNDVNLAISDMRTKTVAEDAMLKQADVAEDATLDTIDKVLAREQSKLHEHFCKQDVAALSLSQPGWNVVW